MRFTNLFVGSLAVLAGCAVPTYTVPSGSPEVAFEPSTVAIGQSFKVKLQRVSHPNDRPETELPDGTYAITAQKWNPSQQNFWDFLTPKTPIAKTTPGSAGLELGKVEVLNGKGEATFVLKGDLGDGTTLEPGLPLPINVNRVGSPNWGVGTGILIAKP
jgi:hypothetical protein